MYGFKVVDKTISSILLALNTDYWKIVSFRFTK